MSSKVWSIGLQKHTKMIQHHVPMIHRSNRLECVKNNDRNEINSVDDHRVWLCIRVTFSSSIVKGYGLPAD